MIRVSQGFPERYYKAVHFEGRMQQASRRDINPAGVEKSTFPAHLWLPKLLIIYTVVVDLRNPTPNTANLESS